MLNNSLPDLGQGAVAEGKEMKQSLIGQGIISGIVASLQAKLVGVPIYTEKVEQNAVKPYLMVKLQSVSHDQRMNGRFARGYTFDIELHSDTYAQTYEWLEQMLEVLVEIEAEDGPLRGTDVKAEMKEGVLHVGVSYVVQLMKQTAKPPIMQQLEQRELIAQGG